MLVLVFLRFSLSVEYCHYAFIMKLLYVIFVTELTLTYSKSTIETLEKGVTYVQS